MDGWLKTLLAATCIAILAGIGYYFYGEIRLAADRAEEAKTREYVRRELFQLAGATPQEADKVRKFCTTLVSPSWQAEKDAFYRRIVGNCRALGYL